MKFKCQKLENKNMQVEVTLSKEEWDKEVTDAYNKNKGKYKIEGFRNGKAPRHMIEKFYGPTVFFEEALTNGFQKAYMEVLSKEKFEPIDAPSLSVKSIDDKGVVILAEIPVMPEVKLNQYKGFGVEVATKEITDSAVKHELKHAQERSARFVEVEREIKSGDTANIDFVGSVDGVEFEGGKSQAYDLEIGCHSFIDTFEDQLIGLKAGDKKDVIVTFPKNYQAKELAGKEAKFAVVINVVKEKQLPELNDEWASSTSQFETLEEYKKDLKNTLVKQEEERVKIELENKIIDKIVENMEVSIPTVMIEQELDNIIKDMQYRLSYQGIRFEDYLTYLNTTEEKFRKDKTKDAEKSVKVRLALTELMKLEKMKITDKEFDKKLDEITKKLNKSVEDYKKTMTSERESYIKNEILMEKILNFLIKNNKIEK